MKLGKNIARNEALRENVFMMVVCIDNRIPLFLVGKPGSSKSLAKTEVAKAMMGDYSSSRLFKKLKEVTISMSCRFMVLLGFLLHPYDYCKEKVWPTMTEVLCIPICICLCSMFAYSESRIFLDLHN